jgi:hypothetical protein
MTTKLPNAHKMYPVVVQYSKWSEYITTFSIPRSSKIYPNWDFWFEKKPSGNPALEAVFSREKFPNCTSARPFLR